ncbi:LOW QUALITY PROTEIN: hypothetical protein PanWU01x14_167190 [Parasponia andersonii]|uniref:Uncharacterized protein n=1 Tax=Parasponia andersonii TaxID=3476 RepID=A0A2P5CBC0_PARAD|nr:LOW QUALITY PROTEIN: hypothetical protein PanWU01x14_167190 [Parasponia andersonii]
MVPCLQRLLLIIDIPLSKETENDGLSRYHLRSTHRILNCRWSKGIQPFKRVNTTSIGREGSCQITSTNRIFYHGISQNQKHKQGCNQNTTIPFLHSRDHSRHQLLYA